MTKENRGGGEPKGGGEDFDAVLAEVVNEVGDRAKQRVVHAKNVRTAKEQRAGSAGELGKRLKGISAEESGAEEELAATYFNTLVFSEFGDGKIPDGVKTKLDAYNSAKEKYRLKVKKMENFHDDVRQDPRLAKPLGELKSEIVARAKDLAGELGVNYEEIAKGEMSLLTTEDAEIKRLEAEADKLSPGKIEYAKESYKDYKERIVGVLADRMAEITQSKLEELLLKNGVKEKPGYHETGNQFKGNIEATTQDVIRKDEKTVKKGMRLLAEKELQGLFEKIDASESDESKRRAVIARLERKFGGLVGRDSFGGLIQADKVDSFVCLRSGASENEANDATMPELLIDASIVEARIMFVLESFCINHGGRVNVAQSGLPDEDLDYRQMCFLKHVQADPGSFSFEQWVAAPGGIDKIVRGKKKLDLDPKHDPTLTDLAIKAGGIWDQVENPYLLFGRNGVSNLDETHDIPSDLFREYAKVKKHEKGLTDEQKRESDAWNHELEKHLKGHELTNQDIVDKAAKPDGTIRLDKPETMKAMIAVLQEQGRKAREVGAGKAEKIGEQGSEIYELKRSLADMTRWKDQLLEENKTSGERLSRSRGENEKQIKALESRIDLADKEKQRVEKEKISQVSALRGLITEAIGKLEGQKTRGLPILGGAKELSERQRVIDDIKQRAGIK